MLRRAIKKQTQVIDELYYSADFLKGKMERLQVKFDNVKGNGSTVYQLFNDHLWEVNSQLIRVQDEIAKAKNKEMKLQLRLKKQKSRLKRLVLPFVKIYRFLFNIKRI